MKLLSISVLFLASCSTVSTVHNLHVEKQPRLSAVAAAQPGKIYELPAHSEASWLYLTNDRQITVSWLVYPFSSLPLTPVPDLNWDAQLEKDCLEWSSASKSINGYPESYSMKGRVVFNGISSPIIEWGKKEANGTQTLSYITALRINSSNLRAHLHAESAAGQAISLSYDQAVMAFEELAKSEQWRKLFK